MNKDSASFCISIDLELAWGVSDKLNEFYLNHAINSERLICNQLIKMFDNYKIPVSWATVSALLDENNKNIGIADKKAWYAPDIIDKILTSKIDHLVASHSYAHLNFKLSTKKEIEKDFEKSNFFFNKFGIKTNSLVFPRNQVHHIDILNKFNYKFYRSIDKSWYKKVSKFNNFAGKISNIIDKTIPVKSNTIKPILDNYNLIEVPSSLLLISRNGFKNLITNASMYRKIRLGIDEAIKKKECFHLWFHPSNFYTNSKKQFLLLNKVLKYVSDKRELGQIKVIKLNEFNV